MLLTRPIFTSPPGSVTIKYGPIVKFFQDFGKNRANSFRDAIVIARPKSRQKNYFFVKKKAAPFFAKGAAFRPEGAAAAGGI